MNAGEIMSTDFIIFDQSIKRQDELFRLLSKLLKKYNVITDENGFIKDLYKREDEISTGIEDGFGIPHAQSEFITTPVICFASTSPMKDYVGLDGKPIDQVFLIAVPMEVKEIHLDILSSLSRKLVNEDFRKSIRNASTKEEIIEIMN